MDLNKDFEELFALLNKHKVDFVIVGGYAVVFHGYPRFTGDIDLFYKIEEKNGRALLEALKDFGFQLPELTLTELCKKGQIVQLGEPPNRIDLLNKISGVDFEKAWPGRVKGLYGKESVFYIGLEELLLNKKAADRSKDRDDLDFFRQKK